MHHTDVARYLDRIGLEWRSVTTDLAGLALLQHAHLATVPFENLDIVFGNGVAPDQATAIEKIIDRRRGGWCFELNGAFALLLEALGFDVTMLGAAVLLDGPSTLIEHLALEVGGGDDDIEPHLVDVGFGVSAVRPIALNRAGPQDGGNATYELFASPQGTTLSEHVDGIPSARMRFKRVAHTFGDFDAVARTLVADPSRHWSTEPMATRLISVESTDRVTLLTDKVRFVVDGVATDRPVDHDEWDALLDEWFGIERPGPWPDATATDR